MCGASRSFDVSGGRFQFDSIVARTEKCVYPYEEAYVVLATGPAHTA